MPGIVSHRRRRRYHDPLIAARRGPQTLAGPRPYLEGRRSEATAAGMAAMPVKTEWLFRSPTTSLHSWRCRGENRQPGAETCQEHFEIAVVLEGLFVFDGPRGSAVADPNTAACFNVEEPYRTRHPAAGGDAGLSVVVEPEALAELVATHSLPDYEVHGARFPPLAVALGARTHLLLSILRQRLLGRAALDPLVLEETLLHLLRRIWDDHRAAAASNGARTPRASAAPDSRDRVRAVKELLAQNLDSKLRLREAADVAGLSPQQLCRVFKRETGTSMHRYRCRLRLRAATARLLAHAPDLSALALDAGFCHHSHFTREFRRELGLTPSQVRRAAQPSPRPGCGGGRCGPGRAESG
jgi:AraC family transcriptional regulator